VPSFLSDQILFQQYLIQVHKLLGFGGLWCCRAQEQSPTMVIHSMSLCLKGHLHTSVNLITILESLLYVRPLILQLDAKERVTNLVCVSVSLLQVVVIITSTCVLRLSRFWAGLCFT
jgi:hypothetical protein